MTDPAPAVLNIDNLTYGYHRPLQSHLDLTVRPGESVTIMGRSGCGKTTLLKTLLGFHKPISGTITIAGTNIYRLRRNQLATFRRDTIGAIFQDGELLPGYSAIENVVIPRLLAPNPDPEATSDAQSLLEALGIEPTTFAEHLSGGERQRTALARALINRPQILLADEPTGSLDPETRDEALKMLLTTAASRNCALLLVTHDNYVAEQTDRITKIDL